MSKPIKLVTKLKLVFAIIAGTLLTPLAMVVGSLGILTCIPASILLVWGYSQPNHIKKPSIRALFYMFYTLIPLLILLCIPGYIILVIMVNIQNEIELGL